MPLVSHIGTKKLPPLPSIGDLLRLYRLRARKHLSQNFLTDEKIMTKIVRSAGLIEGGFVCEVGPGPGGITRSIMNKSPRHIVLVEKDTRFKPMLDILVDVAGDLCRIDVVYNDILGFNLKSFPDASYKKEWKDDPPNVHAIGNLPFDVATILIIRWLRDISLRENLWSFGRAKMTLTFQKEVAERIVAPPLSRQRCRLSVMCQNWCLPTQKFNISRGSFVPSPKVEAGVVHFVPLRTPIIPLKFELIEKVLRTAFGCRQKELCKVLGFLFPLSLREDLSEKLFTYAEVDKKLRPYQLSVEEWGRICFAYKEICDDDPPLYNYNYRGPILLREKMWKEQKTDVEEDLRKNGGRPIDGSGISTISGVSESDRLAL